MPLIKNISGLVNHTPNLQLMNLQSILQTFPLYCNSPDSFPMQKLFLVLVMPCSINCLYAVNAMVETFYIKLQTQHLKKLAVILVIQSISSTVKVHVWKGLDVKRKRNTLEKALGAPPVKHTSTVGYERRFADGTGCYFSAPPMVGGDPPNVLEETLWSKFEVCMYQMVCNPTWLYSCQRGC